MANDLSEMIQKKEEIFNKIPDDSLDKLYLHDYIENLKKVKSRLDQELITKLKEIKN